MVKYSVYPAIMKLFKCMVVVGLGGVGTKLNDVEIQNNHDRCAPATMHLRFTQTQPKMYHSLKFEDRVENRFFTSWTYIYRHFF